MSATKPSRWVSWGKRAAFALAALITLIALVWAFENYRGKRRWQACKADLEAKGEVFDFRQLVPARVKDEENLFMTPLLRPCSDFAPDEPGKPARLRDPDACERITRRFAWTGHIRGSANGWRLGQFVDLAAWQQRLRATPEAATAAPAAAATGTGPTDTSPARTNTVPPADSALEALRARPPAKPAEDLLFVLAQTRAELDELRAAAQRPFANLNARYDENIRHLIPQLALVKGLAQPFYYSALANLAHGDAPAAARDLLVILRLGEGLENEPLLIAGLVRIAVQEMAMQPLWEGLTRHEWSDAHLQEFNRVLQRANAVAAMARCLRGERTFSISMIGSRPEPAGAGPVSEEDAALRAYSRLPAAMIYQNQYEIARFYQEQVLPAFDAAAGAVDLSRLEDRAVQAWFGRRTPYNVFARLLAPAIVPAARRAAQAQATLNLARVAIALERARLTNGNYPTTLAELAPRFIETVPPDPVNGQPLRYRRSDSDRFTLYSLAANGQDDGGQVAVTPKGALAPKALAGDWVWQNHAVTNTVTARMSPE